MKKFPRAKRSFIITCILVISVFIFSTCVDNADKKIIPENKDSFAEYAGDEKCGSCHKDIFEAHLKSGHYNTSKL